MSFEKDRKRPMDGVVRVAKANVVQHGFDGFIGYCVGHPDLLRNEARFPDSLEQFLQAEAKKKSQRTAEEILAVWSSKSSESPTSNDGSKPVVVSVGGSSSPASSMSVSLASTNSVAPAPAMKPTKPQISEPTESQIMSKANELRDMVNNSKNSKFRAMMERSIQCAGSMKAHQGLRTPKPTKASAPRTAMELIAPKPDPKPIAHKPDPKPPTTKPASTARKPNPKQPTQEQGRAANRRGSLRKNEWAVRQNRGASSNLGKRKSNDGCGYGKPCDHKSLGVYQQSYFNAKVCQQTNYPSKCSKCQKFLYRTGVRGESCHLSKGLHEFFCCINAVNDPWESCVFVLCQGCYSTATPTKRQRQSKRMKAVEPRDLKLAR